MQFIPAGEIIGDLHQVRTVRIARNPQLPDGDYSFVDSYCTDLSCDCRKTMIHVLHGGQCVSIINFGWEKPSYYKEWMGVNTEAEDEITSLMCGSSIDISSPDLVSSEAILDLFNSLLNKEWIGIFKRNYAAVKADSAQN